MGTLQLTASVATLSSPSSCSLLSVPACSTAPCYTSLHRSKYNFNHRLSWRNGWSCSRSRLRSEKQELLVGREDIEITVQEEDNDEEEQEDDTPPTEEEQKCIDDIKRVLELLKKNRDMLFSEVKLTVMIEDLRDVERKRLLGIEDPGAPSRDDLAEALEQVNDGKVPRNRAALRMLAEEITSWPNLEVEATKKQPGKSLYAKSTDTGVDPKEAARRLKVDWDEAADIEDQNQTVSKESDVPAAVGYGALYLVSAFPIIIGVSVVLILFYNSLQ